MKQIIVRDPRLALLLAIWPALVGAQEPPGPIDCSMFKLWQPEKKYCAAPVSPQAGSIGGVQLVDEVLDTSRAARARGRLNPKSVIYPDDKEKVTHPYKIIPFRIQDPKAEAVVLEALCQWQLATVVKFRPAAKDEKTTTIEFKTDDTRQDYKAAETCLVFRETPSRTAFIGGCLIKDKFLGGPKGSVAHEIGHLLGLQHEQIRPDRDKFFEIDIDGMPLDKAKQYSFDLKEDAEKKRSFKLGAKVSEDYDFASIMHYPPNEHYKFRPEPLPANVAGPATPSANRLPESSLLKETRELLKKQQLGSRDVGKSECISREDAASINSLYKDKKDGP